MAGGGRKWRTTWNERGGVSSDRCVLKNDRTELPPRGSLGLKASVVCSVPSIVIKAKAHRGGQQWISEMLAPGLGVCYMDAPPSECG